MIQVHIEKNYGDIVSNPEVRKAIVGFEEALAQHPDAVIGDSPLCPVKHSFSDGMYVREIFIPKGTILTGKIHRHDHPNFLMSGEVEVMTESGGVEILKGPCSMISPAGTKRVVRAIEDAVWITVHANESNTTDLKKLEENIIAKTYDDLKPKGLLKGIVTKMLNMNNK